MITNKKPSDFVFSVQLLRVTEADQFQVQRVELLRDGMRHRINSTKADNAVLSVFTDAFAEFLETVLAKQTAPRMVLTESTSVFRAENVTLSGIQMMTNLTVSGWQKVFVRFTNVSGKIQSVLRDVVPSVQIEPKNIAMEALEHVVGRAYDVTRVQHLVPGFCEAQSHFRGPSRTIDEKQRELLFRLHLLQLAVDHGRRDAELAAVTAGSIQVLQAE